MNSTSSHENKRMNVECDRLSNLPDDLIHKILSFVSIKQAIETSALSSRWRYIWTSLPSLNLSTKDFRRLPNFSKFVTSLLSKRNDQSEVFSVDLTFRGKAWQEFVKRILDYAFSHNVQQLKITCLLGYSYAAAEFPPSLFSSQSLKHLTLIGRVDNHYNKTPPAWVLPSLITLNLHGVSFYDEKSADQFSNCANLKNLTLKGCIILKGFSIRHPGLSSLTLEGSGDKRIKVITPQLKNLTLKYRRGIHLVSAPTLSSLHYTDSYCSYKDDDDGPLQLPTDLLHLEKVDICINSTCDDNAYTRKILSLLQRLHSVKFLTLNLELVKFLSSVELISHQTSPFVNLKSLKIYPFYVPEEATQQKVTMPTEVKNYLLDSSPGATFTMVSYEEIRVVKNVTSARDRMKELQDNLKEIETKMTNIERDKAPMKRHVATLSKLVEDLQHTVFKLKSIDALLKNVPTSHRDNLQARLSGLWSEAGTILNRVKDRMKIQFDKKFDEPATSSQPSS